MNVFRNSDAALREGAARVVAARAQAGLGGLVGDLACVIINTEPGHLVPAVQEMLRYTGLTCADAFEDDTHRCYVLRVEHSADVLLRCRKDGDSPFQHLNRFPKSSGLPNTRLESYVFHTHDLDRLVSIQKSLGVEFQTESPEERGHCRWIQTTPSKLSGNATGYIECAGSPGRYRDAASKPLEAVWHDSRETYQIHIGALDHAATRLRARDRNAAVLEFMNLTNYTFDGAFYVEPSNSITSVVRLPLARFALVFTSGISPYENEETAGPTEKFVHNYGPRTHHLAFNTNNIEQTFEALGRDGMEFLLDLVGGPGAGLHQTFSAPSPHTLLVFEYIHRYGGFDGFFTLDNVTSLTEATDNQ
ncbi:MAG: hypothetical protein GWP08_11140 [Nitrospiraceae bacterium]|nr:hypothetical protein [Nitrospiraceae bacterium]